MFTHKQVEACPTLALAIINAGSGCATWLIHTEREHFLYPVLQTPKQRHARSRVDPKVDGFET